ncbi:MAG: cellobiose transport system substrate-binding protein [Streptosporangiaceae bacterium]|jgi:cellobiose transport system substrate-binding protein|nr:extracellular solute-binding protein family 1 [Streptosporangiaceae bacterium]MDX6432003.1 cellobiose transport system substrate-binding protein [Streptosporangiaceae bacterium]
MRDTMRRAPRIAAATVMAGVLALAAACSGENGKSSGSSGSGKITLTVDSFGTFGYEDLYKQYEASHPNIKIVDRNIPSLDNYLPQLQQHIAAGAGAGDIVAIEEGIAVKFMAQPDKFVDLNKYGAAALKGNFLPWKWQQGLSVDGSKVVGLGTDVGGLAMCYRKDLFQKAGLGNDRETVGKLWPTWDAFLATGKKFQAKVPGTKFMDGATNFYNTILMQEAGKGTNQTYFDKSNKLIIDSNPAVKAAYDRTVQLAQANLTAKIQFLTDPWSQALKKDAFATVTCPAWMLGLIKENAGAAKAGKWDITTLPGGGGSWGGSFLAVPTQSKHPKEAADLAKFLTSPQGQVGSFKSKNNLPSSPQALDDPAVKDFKNDYFSGAPVGQIFASGAKSLNPVFLGANNQPVRTVVEADLRAIEQGKLTPDAGWKKVISDAKRAAETG